MPTMTRRARWEAIDNDPEIAYALERIRKQYGVEASVALKGKALNVYGSTDEVDTNFRTIAQLGVGEINETYVSDNLIDAVVSTDGGDTEPVVIIGHTIDGAGDFTRVEQTVTLNGQTPVALPTPLARADEIYADGSNDLVGTISVYEDSTSVASGVPADGAAVHLVIVAGENRSFKASVTIDKNEYWLIRSITIDINKKASASVDVISTVREKGKVFLPLIPLSVSTTGVNSFEEILEPMIIIPANADFRVLSAALSGSGIAVSASINGYLAAAV